jgi:hypothetical protein
MWATATPTVMLSPSVAVAQPRLIVDLVQAIVARSE